MLQVTDEHELYPEDQVVVLNWGPLGWYDPRVESWSMGRLLGTFLDLEAFIKRA